MDEAPIDIPALTASDLVERLKSPRDPDDANNAMNHAYRRVFGNQIGRLVLADIALAAGVSRRRGVHMSDAERAWTDGQNDLALEILSRAGFGPEAVAVFTLTDNLEGQETDDRDNHSRNDDHGDEPDFGD